MKLVIPVSRHDSHRLEKLVDVLLHFGGLEHHPIMFYPTPDAVEETYRQAGRMGLYRPEIVPTDRNFDGGAPAACNQHFASAVYALGKQNNNLPWLWFEVDMMPVCADWVSKLQREYYSINAALMGNIVHLPYWNLDTKTLTLDSGDLMMMGCGVYPAKMEKDQRITPLILSLTYPPPRNPEGPFDVFLRHAFKHTGWSDTKLISDQWNTCNYRYDNGQLVCESMPVGERFRQRGGVVNPEAVLVHGCKDDSLHALMMKQPEYYVPKKEPTEVVPDSLPDVVMIDTPTEVETVEPLASTEEEKETLQEVVESPPDAVSPQEQVTALITGKTTNIKFMRRVTGLDEETLRKCITDAGYKVARAGLIVKA